MSGNVHIPDVACAGNTKFEVYLMDQKSIGYGAKRTVLMLFLVTVVATVVVGIAMSIQSLLGFF